MLAPFVNTAQGIMLAANHPERVSHLVVVNGAARVTWAPDYPAGIPQEVLDSSRTWWWIRMPSSQATTSWQYSLRALPTTPRSALGGIALATGGPHQPWRRRFSRQVFNTTSRILPNVNVPTLIIQRKDLRSGGEHGRYLAEHVPAAKYVELPGADVLCWIGDTGPMLDEIEEFVTGVRGGSGTERILATVLFTDIVESTARVAQLGDGRWRISSIVTTTACAGRLSGFGVAK